MIIKVYRAKQYSDTVGSGWADYAYSFEPIQSGERDGCGGGVCGHCVIDEATEPWHEYEVPDGSELTRDYGDGPPDEQTLRLAVPGHRTTYSAAEMVYEPRACGAMVTV